MWGNSPQRLRTVEDRLPKPRGLLVSRGLARAMLSTLRRFAQGAATPASEKPAAEKTDKKAHKGDKKAHKGEKHEKEGEKKPDMAK